MKNKIVGLFAVLFMVLVSVVSISTPAQAASCGKGKAAVLKRTITDSAGYAHITKSKVWIRKCTSAGDEYKQIYKVRGVTNFYANSNTMKCRTSVGWQGSRYDFKFDGFKKVKVNIPCEKDTKAAKTVRVDMKFHASRPCAFEPQWVCIGQARGNITHVLRHATRSDYEWNRKVAIS